MEVIIGTGCVLYTYNIYSVSIIGGSTVYILDHVTIICILGGVVDMHIL